MAAGSGRDRLERHETTRHFLTRRIPSTKSTVAGMRIPAFRRYALSDTFPRKGAILWFTNLCEDCRARAPLLEEVVRESSDRYDVLAVSLLSEADTRRLAGSWAFPVPLDPDDIVARRLGLPHPPGACPMHNLFILDDHGQVRFRYHLSALKPDVFRSKWRTAPIKENAKAVP